jgi:hypothetical protein
MVQDDVLESSSDNDHQDFKKKALEMRKTKYEEEQYTTLTFHSSRP